ESELQQVYKPLWFAVLNELRLVGHWQRGFLEVRVSGIRRLLEMADRLFSAPWILHLNLADRAADREAVADLVDSPYFIRIRRLDLSRSALTNEGVQLLTRSRAPCRLTHLDLSSNQISSNGLRALLDNMDLTYLTELRLVGNGISKEGARALANSTQL